MRAISSARCFWAAFAVTRLLMVALVVLDLAPSGEGVVTGVSGDVVHVYWPDHLALAAGQLPYRDFALEYPPGQVLALWPFPFVRSLYAFAALWFILMLCLDGHISQLLWRTARNSGGDGHLAGAWLWLASGPLLGGLTLARNDLLGCACAVGAVVSFRSGKVRCAGALVSLGVLFKLWPVVVFLALLVPRGARGRLAAGLGSVLVPFGLLIAASGLVQPMIRNVVGYHEARGAEIESLAALPSLWASALFGHRLQTTTDHGSVNLAGSAGIATLASWATLAAAGSLVVLLVLGRRRSYEIHQLLEIAAGTLALAMLTSKVLSPQYILWVAVLACAASCAGGRRGPLLACGLAVFLTGMEYPSLFSYLPAGSWVAVTVLTLRDLALAGFMLLSLAPYVRVGRRQGVAADAASALGAFPSPIGRDLASGLVR